MGYIRKRSPKVILPLLTVCCSFPRISSHSNTYYLLLSQHSGSPLANSFSTLSTPSPCFLQQLFYQASIRNYAIRFGSASTRNVLFLNFFLNQIFPDKTSAKCRSFNFSCQKLVKEVYNCSFASFSRCLRI